MADVNPEPGTVDEQMDRSIRGEPPETDLAELVKPQGKGCVIGDREIQLEQVSERTQEDFGLPERIVSAASIAMSAYTRCPPGSPLGAARQVLIASSQNQMVRSPRPRRPASYWGQLRTRYRDFAYLYWLRFGYFMGGGLRIEGRHQNDAPRSGAMHQRRSPW